MKNTIDKIVFRPFIFHRGEEERLVIIYGSNTQVAKSVTFEGDKEVDVSHVLYLCDVTATIDHGHPVLEGVPLNRPEEFLKCLSEPNLLERVADIVLATNIIIENIEGMQMEISELSNALLGIRYVSNQFLSQEQLKQSGFPDIDNSLEELNDDLGHEEDFDDLSDLETETKEGEGSLFFTSDIGPLANIVFKAVGNAEGKLQRKDIEKIGGVIRDVVKNNLDIDPKNADSVKKLGHEIEYKIIEALPNSLKAGEININTDAIIEQIAQMNKENRSENED